MRKRKKSYAKADLSYLSRFMGALVPDQKRLGEIQAVYDNLTLLGQLLGAGTDISSMRQDFQHLATVLLEQLAKEHYKKAALNLGSCARVAIDVLTRNLFERTADIGFLATDTQICSFAEAVEANPEVKNDPGWRLELQKHFAEYVSKYSVYHNIILLSPTGEVLVQLEGNNPVTQTTDRLLDDALTTTEGYIEVSRPVDLLPNDATPLIYAYRVMSSDGSHPVGVLCLCFKFQDECQRIFESLVAEDDWSVLTLLDANNTVISSSDPYQFPVGARLEPIADDACHIIRFSGREYLATSRKAHPYQGYAGPGWVGHALAPLNHAFDISESLELEGVSEDYIQSVLDVSTLFTHELRNIPVRAETIQQELNRAVWNGNIWLARDNNAHNSEFAKVLLREIGSTGAHTRDVFSEATANLYKTVISSVLFDCGTQAALAIDIMDRNLYERANDCRWWALTKEFRHELACVDLADSEQQKRLRDILRRINSLYTVYSNMVLFDRSGRVVALSNPAYNDWIGKPVNESWVRETLGLKEAQLYSVSDFANSELYAGHPTYVFTAAVRAPQSSEPVGGIAIVFDSTSQFKAMLDDVLPRQENGDLVEGAFAVFAEGDGKVVASTHPEIVPCTRLEIGREFLTIQPGDGVTKIVEHHGKYYAVGSCMSAGYREYSATGTGKSVGVVALVFTPLSDSIATEQRRPPLRASNNRLRTVPTRGVETVDIASFYIGQSWYGLKPSSVIAAVDAERLTPMPGTSEFVAGCLMFDERAISVFDLSSILSPVRPDEERRKLRSSTGKRQILILNSQHYQTQFGILVDNLAEITEIASHRIEPVPGMMSDGNSLIDSLVKPMENDAERRILIVLSTEKLAKRFAAPAAITVTPVHHSVDSLQRICAIA
uniref:CheW protein n=1 Tax=Dechloromonas aromatica (strain RCB) TaxID=159087 RepID=Q47H54_DECAR